MSALVTAVAAASATGLPAVLCTHHHTARAACAPGPGTRVLTSHQPPEKAPHPPASRWHAHLPPSPTQAELATAVARLIIPDAEDGK